MNALTFPRACSRLLIMAASLGAWAIPAPAHAQNDAYKKGLGAYQDSHWKDAVTQMRAAIEADKTESDKKTVKVGGTFGIGGTEYPYLPYYFLGEALMAQNECVQAMDALAESERQRVVTGKRLEAIRSHYQTCAAQGILAPAAFATQRTQANQKYVDARAQFNRVSARAAANKGAAGANADQLVERARKAVEDAFRKLNDGLGSHRRADFTESSRAADSGVDILRRLDATITAAIDTQTAAQRQLQELEQAIAAAESADKAIDATGFTLTSPMAGSRKNGRNEVARAHDARSAAQRALNPAVVKEGIDHARSAVAIFNGLLGDVEQQAKHNADQQRVTVSRQATNAMAQVDEAFAAFDRRVALETDSLPDTFTVERGKLRKDADGLKRRVARAASAGDVAGLTQATQQATAIRGQVEALLQTLPPLSLRARGIPEGLEDGARLYLRGDYEQALTALDGIGNGGAASAPMQIHLHLFKAAARYALYVRSGETKKEWLEQALAEIEQCKRIDAAFTPDARAFAPRFLALYQQAHRTN
jgi:hypothetical protein